MAGSWRRAQGPANSVSSRPSGREEKPLRAKRPNQFSSLAMQHSVFRYRAKQQGDSKPNRRLGLRFNTQILHTSRHRTTISMHKVTEEEKKVEKQSGKQRTKTSPSEGESCLAFSTSLEQFVEFQPTYSTCCMLHHRPRMLSIP